MMKKQAANEERQYAIQQEHLRRQQIINDRKMKNDHKKVKDEHKLLQTAQAADQKARWVDPYHEKDMEHTHAGNLKL